MEVILIADVDNLGTRGQIVKVASGYGRNHLLPKKMAVAATPANRKWVEQQRARFLKLAAKEKGEAQELAQIMEGLHLVFKRKTGEQGALFGSVTAMDVAEALAAKGFHIDRRKVQMPSPLKTLGNHDVSVRLHREVPFTLRVTIESENPQPEPAKAAPAETAVQAAAAAPAEPAATQPAAAAEAPAPASEK